MDNLDKAIKYLKDAGERLEKEEKKEQSEFKKLFFETVAADNVDTV